MNIKSKKCGKNEQQPNGKLVNQQKQFIVINSAFAKFSIIVSIEIYLTGFYMR